MRSAPRTSILRSDCLEDSTSDGGAEFGFNGGQTRREQLAPGHDDNIEAWRDVIASENLSYQTLSTISNNGAAQSFRRRNTEAADRRPVRLRKQRVVAARDAGAMLVDVLKLGVPADPLVRAEIQKA